MNRNRKRRNLPERKRTENTRMEEYLQSWLNRRNLGESSNRSSSNLMPSSSNMRTLLTEKICVVCKTVLADKMVTALGKFYHPDHFTCSYCEVILRDYFFEKDGKLYCQNDYHKLFSPKCAKCKKPITEKRVAAMDKLWHPEHFQCEKCGKQLEENVGFYKKNDKAYCSEDFLNMFGIKCFKCQKPVDERCVKALGQVWHYNCFRCQTCNKVFTDLGYIERDGKPYCVQDYLNLFSPECKMCERIIRNSFVFDKFYWHIRCYMFDGN